MKKQFFSLSIIGILLFTLFSCENLFSSKQDISSNVIQTPTLQANVATVKISSKMPRTVLPEAFTENTQGLTWKLTVSGESGTCYTEEWTDTEDGSNTAYQNMLADSFTLATGTYKFSLSVDRVGNDGKRVLYSIIESQEIKLGTNVLNFEMKEATGDSAAPGSIDFTLNFPANVVSKAIATLHKWNSSENKFDIQSYSEDEFSNETNFLSSVNYAKENIAAGTYLLKIQLQKSKVTTQGFETINTYSCIVRVAPGLCSKGEYTLKSLNYGQLFNLSFKLNEGNFESGSSTSMTYNANECIDLPKPTKEGYDFAGWYTDEALQTLVQLESDNKYRITQDITLYAKWEKTLSLNYDFSLINENNQPVTSGASYSVDDNSRFATITVDNPADSEKVWSYLIKSDISFDANKNYTISVDLKATEQTVVGIAAAETDMFFTVGKEWKTYSFETGYLKANSQNGISIGTGLSKTVYVSNLVITESTDQSNLPILSFYISEEGITSYLQGNPNNDIIQVEKTTESTNNNSGYKLTLNSTGVTLQLRDYISQRNLGLYKASFDMKSDNSDLKTSIVAKTTNSEQFAKTWNTATAIGADTKTCNVFVPVYTANEEYIIDGILSEGQTAGDVIEISNYKIENITTLDNTGKVFAIKTDSTWNKSTTLPFTQQVTIQPRSDYVYDVLLMNNFATVPNDESDWNECIRFLNTSEDTDNFTFTFTSENNNTTYKIVNQTEEELTLNITLTADCKVVIEKVESSVIDLTNAWLASQEESSAQGYYYSLPAGNYCVKEDLELKYPIQIAAGGGEVKLYANGNFKITCSSSFTADIAKTYNAMIALPMSAGTLTLGGGTGNLTIDGSGISSLSYLVMSSSTFNLQDKCTITNGNVSYGAVYVGAGTFTMNDGGTITNCKATDGGAVYITGGGTFKMTGGTITGCSATNSGGGVWMNGGSSFTMSGNSEIENCKATSYEGGGVYVTDSSNPCTFKMLDNATITGCSAETGGGGVSYGCGTSGTFEISGNAKILKNRNNNSSSSYGGGGIYLYGKLTMNGGTISGNEASSGAGVYVRDNSSSFTMTGGTISDNKATVSGGGVYLWDPTSSFTMTAGTISNNLLNGINHGASIKINSGNVNLPNTDTLTGGVFTYNIIKGEVQYPSGGTTATYDIGDVYPKDGTPIGVVFKTDTEYVYIIGLEEEQLGYGTRNCVTQIQENAPTTNNFNNEFDGCQNMTNWYSFITTNSEYFSSAEFPAFNYCLTYRDTEGEGGTWYLPASQELSMIQSNIATLNSTLENQDSTQIGTNSQYWSSTYVSEGKANVVGMLSGSTSQNTISTEYYVRPCKRINITDGSSDVLIKGLNVETAGEAISNIYTAGEHYIKLDSSVTAYDLETDIYDELYNLLDDEGNPTAFVYLDLSSTHIQELPPQTFYRLASLKGITLPSTIQTIDASAFQGCINLTKFVVPADNQYFTVDESKPAILLSKDKSKLISYPSATEEYSIPDNITSLAEYAFGDATNLTSVTIHANLTDIPSNAFYGACFLETFDVNVSNQFYSTADNNKQILLSKDKTELISWPYAYKGITIPDSVTKIADYALAETEITSVVLNNVEEIGKYALYGCKNLTSVEFADTNGWSVVNDESEKKSIEVTNSTVTNLTYASDDYDAQGYADYTWIKDSSSTSGGGIANYTDTAGISISNYQYPKTSLVTVISEETRIDCSEEVEGVFGLYLGGSVTLSPFAIGQYEVTQELYEAIMDKNPSTFKSDNITSGETQNLRPVDSVNWYEAVAFCNELTEQTFGETNCVYYSDLSYSTVYTTDDASNKKLPYFDPLKKGYRLPTEAEWEFAARGGDEDETYWNYAYPGIDINDDYSSDNLITVAWFKYLENYEFNTCTHEVGLKLQNGLNLFDMAGNVQEWCWDLPIDDKDTTYYNQNVTDPVGSNNSSENRIVRGGYWDDVADSCKCTYRFQEKAVPTNQYSPNTLGFRICRSL